MSLASSLAPLGLLSRLATLDVAPNGFTGQLPESLDILRQLNSLILGSNKFICTIPDVIGNLVDLGVLLAPYATFEGTIPESMGQLSQLAKLSFHYNNLKGTIIQGIGSWHAMEELDFGHNEMKGTVPENIGACSLRLSRLLLDMNGCDGVFPAAIWSFLLLQEISLDENYFVNEIPDAVGKLALLQSFSGSHAIFEGSVPDGLGQLRALERLSIAYNNLRGLFPEELTELKVLVTFIINTNLLISYLPERLFKLTAVQTFWGSLGTFFGTIPDSIGKMCSLTDLHLPLNYFAGTIPSMIDALSSLTILHLYESTLAGSVPEGVFRMQGLRELLFQENYDLEGTLPSAIAFISELSDLRAFGTAMEGSIPPGVGTLEWLHFFMFHHGHQQLHTGSVPAFTKYSSRLERAIVLGSGFQGAMPPIAGTVKAMSLFDSYLEGGLPAWLLNSSRMFVHGNTLSCKLPRYEGQDVDMSVTLLGNLFTASLETQPPWIDPLEKVAFFCVSNSHGRNVCIKFVLGAVLFQTLLTWRLQSQSLDMTSAFRSSGNRNVQKGFAACVSTIFQQVLFAVFIITARLDESQLTCLPVLNRMLLSGGQTRWDGQILHGSVGVGLIASSARCMLCALHGNITRTSRGARMQRVDSIGRQSQSNPRRAWLRWCWIVTATWCGWLLLCLLLSSVGALFAAVKVIPGFFRFSSLSAWLVTHAVSLTTTLMTSFVLPALVTKAGEHIEAARVEELLALGKLLVVWLIPCVVTVYLHSSCLANWKSWWGKCSPGSHEWFPDRIEVFVHRFNPSRDDIIPLMNRGALCHIGHASLSSRRCASAIMDNFQHLILGSIMNLSFIYPSVQLLGHQTVEKSQAWLLMSTCLQLAMVFGLGMPFLLPFLTVATVTNMFLHVLERSRGAGNQQMYMPVSAFVISGSIAVVVQACSILEPLLMANGPTAGGTHHVRKVHLDEGVTWLDDEVPDPFSGGIDFGDL